jgi:transcriptional regulator with XRE-family HTH domain
MNKEEVGNRLRTFLVSKYGKLNLAAQNLGIIPQTLSKYLRGDFIPGGEFIAKLSELGCDTNWLLGIEDLSKAGKVSEVNNNLYEVKDEVIVQQAEEIFRLRKEIRETTEQMNQLIKRLNDLEGRMKEEPKLSKKKNVLRI